MNIVKSTILKSSALAVAMAGVTVPASAYEAGDVIVRFGPAVVAPDNSSASDNTQIANLRGVSVEVEEGLSLGITTTWMMSNQLGLELLASTPFKHDIEGTGLIAGVDVGDVKHLPPTLLLTYYPPVSGKFQPFFGAGVNYTFFFDEDTDASLTNALGATVTDISVSDSIGAAFEVGVDMALSDHLLLTATVWNIDIDSRARVSADGAPAVSIPVHIDPWVYMLGVGFKF